MNPRPYQFEIDRCIEDGWEEARKQLVVSTMGSGKTVCFALLTNKFVQGSKDSSPTKVLILVDQDELAFQAKRKVEAITDLPVAMEKAQLHADKNAMVVVASVQSLCRRLDKWPQDHFGLVIADEADKSLAATWQRCLKHFDGHARVVGFTATPNRGDCRSLGEYYEHIAFEAYFFDFIGNGKWAFDETSDPKMADEWRRLGLKVEVIP